VKEKGLCRGGEGPKTTLEPNRKMEVLQDSGEKTTGGLKGPKGKAPSRGMPRKLKNNKQPELIGGERKSGKSRRKKMVSKHKEEKGRGTGTSKKKTKMDGKKKVVRRRVYWGDREEWQKGGGGTRHRKGGQAKKKGGNQGNKPGSREEKS